MKKWSSVTVRTIWALCCAGVSSLEAADLIGVVCYKPTAVILCVIGVVCYKPTAVILCVIGVVCYKPTAVILCVILLLSWCFYVLRNRVVY